MMKNNIYKNLSRVDYDFFSAKKEWRQFCISNDNDIPLYMKDWFWDATCDSPDDWWVILVKDKNNEILAAFPFKYTRRLYMYCIENPWQVAAAGFWIRPNESKGKLKEIKHLKYITEQIVPLLPYYDRFRIIFNKTLWTWQTFYWLGFNAKPYYSMIISNINNEQIEKHIDADRRKRINRGKKYYTINVDNLTFDNYWNFYIQCYQKINRKISYKKEMMRKLMISLQNHNACQLRSIYRDDDLVAVNIMLIDKERLYHQFGTQLDANAQSYAIYDAICESMRQNKIFDFEGSMIPGVCEFNSSFNPQWETHYLIEKYSTRYIILDCIFKIIVTVKNIFFTKK